MYNSTVVGRKVAWFSKRAFTVVTHASLVKINQKTIEEQNTVIKHETF